jgi:hypothetical protein
MGSITGAVPLIEKQRAHHGFVDAVHPPVVALKINHARRYVRDGETAASVFPKQTRVVTTTTINDTTLSYLRWDDEFEILRDFQPDYHVPVDYPTYRSTDDEHLQTYVRKMAEGLLELADRLDSHRDDFRTGPPELLPLARKYLPDESVPNPIDVGDGLGLTQYAFYASQYFTSPETSIVDLVEDLEQAAEVIPDDASLFVLGSLTPYHLDRFPEAVTAVSGLNAWRKRVTPRDSTPAEIRDSYHALASDVNAELEATVATSYHPDAPREMREGSPVQSEVASLDQFTASPE